MVTRRVNGGLNGYQDRLHWYDKVALEILGASDVRTFQKSAGLVVDGISGPKTRAALHEALGKMKVPTLATAPKTPAQAQSAPKPSPAKETAKTVAGGATGAGLVVAVLAFASDVAQAWHDGWVWVFSFFN